MSRNRSLLLLGALSLATLARAADGPRAAEAYRVIVNPKNPVASVERAELARLFMKKVAAWPDGTPVVAVDRERTAPVRGAFSKDVHNKDADAIAAHWATLVYAGREFPPTVKQSDDAVLEFVRNTPGAVGYVSAATPLSGVKAISVR